MNNQVGIGVFATFGDPVGYQQAFHFGATFAESLDLNDDAIEFYPGSELFSVKRELVDGVYTVCFSIYSYVRELNTERFGTFIGTCIVLRDCFADADYIYKALLPLHKDVIGNPANVVDTTLKALQAKDIVVREPENFVALRANLIPISKTPFFSTYVDNSRSLLIIPDALSGENKQMQVINFYDHAFKEFNDTGTIYYSFDSGVADFVVKAGIISTMEWSDFADRKPLSLPASVVRTKKGIQKVVAAEPVAVERDYNPDTDRIVSSSFDEPIHDRNVMADGTGSRSELDMDDEDDDANPEDDRYKPFDLWEYEIPETGWTAAEAKMRMREYNRLFQYTNTLQEHIKEPAGKSSRKKRSPIAAPSGEMAGGSKKRKRVLISVFLGLVIAICVSAFIYFFQKERNTEQMQYKQEVVSVDSANSDQTITADNTETEVVSADTVDAPVVAAVKTRAVKDDGKIVPMQPVARVPIGPPTLEQADAVLPPPPTGSSNAANSGPAEAKKSSPSATSGNEGSQGSTRKTSAVGAGNSPLTADKYVPQPSAVVTTLLLPKEPPTYTKSKELHPRPNIEITQGDIPILKQTGVSNKTLSQLTQLLFDNVPSNIGNIYKGQEEEFAAALLNNNRQLFRKSDGDYICTTDNTMMHIPAYKSPRLPVVFPK